MSHSVHILFEIKEGPWGGGNQFLKALRAYLVSTGDYCEDAEDAAVIIFNSHHHLDRALELKRKHPGKIFLHRCDGPIFVVRGSGWEVDRAIFRHNQSLADGTIFQSEWSRARAREQGMPPNRFETVIHNAPDQAIFHPAPVSSVSPDGRLRVVAMSWSTNPLKGFDVYSLLDENLDPDRFAMTFIGNSPRQFRRIRQIPALDSLGVAEALRNHDLFISASHMEACSNAIVEAMNCGIPALVRDNSSQPELVRDKRLVFKGPGDVLEALDRVAADLDSIRAAMRPETMLEVGASYAAFARDVQSAATRPGGTGVKRLTTFTTAGLRAAGFADRIRLKLGLLPPAPAYRP